MMVKEDRVEMNEVEAEEIEETEASFKFSAKKWSRHICDVIATMETSRTQCVDSQAMDGSSSSSVALATAGSTLARVSISVGLLSTSVWRDLTRSLISIDHQNPYPVSVTSPSSVTHKQLEFVLTSLDLMRGRRGRLLV